MIREKNEYLHSTYLYLPVDRLGKLCVPEEGRQELEESCEKLSVHWPALLLRGERENAADKHAVRHNLQPGIGEPGGLLRYQECDTVTNL